MNTQILTNAGIDINHGLELLGDMKMYNETITDFYNELETRINDLKNFKETGDISNYSILAHAIKSDCKYLGIMNLADMSLEHEMAGKENNIDFINTNFDNYINEIEKYKNIIKEYLG